MDKAYAMKSPPERTITKENFFFKREKSHALLGKEIRENPEKYYILSKKEERYFFERYKKGDKSIEQELVNHNLRLVLKNANHFWNNWGKKISFMELLQEGLIGLKIAIEKFDLDRGLKFSTYATYWVNQAILRYCYKNCSQIRQPEHMKVKVLKFSKIRDKFIEEGGRIPTDEELAEVFGYTSDDINELKKYSAQGVCSLDAGLDNTDISLTRVLSDSSTINPEDNAIERVQSDKMISFLNTVLDERETKVIILRYGLNDGVPRTLDEIGKAFDLSRERIRQIERKAKLKLKNYPKELEAIVCLE